MKISPCYFKDVPAFEVTAGFYKAIVLPTEGGKLASFIDTRSKKEYLVQNPSKKFLHTGIFDDFEKCECAGFDDMFPTVDPVTVTYPDGVSFDYPDHGEVCRMPFSYEIGEDFLGLRYYSKTLGYEYEKIFTEDSDGALRIDYHIKNNSVRELDALWAGHCLVSVQRGGRVIVPFDDGESVDVVDDSTGDYFKNERVALKGIMLDTVWSAPYYRKLYFSKKAPDGYIGYTSPAGETFMLEFDKKELPYIGIWIDYGCVTGSYYVGLEPASLGYDTVENAKAYGQKDIIPAGGSKEFFIRLFVR